MSAPPILCYHKVDTRLELGVTRLGPRVFRRQMEALARAGVRTLGSAELEALVTGGAAAGRGGPISPPHVSRLTSLTSVVLTFDDAYAALAEHAFPVLADLGLTALVFVITDFAGRENSWDVQYGWRGFRHLAWDDLARWRDRGVIEVHAHGAIHARLTWLPDALVEQELGRARETIAARLGGAPSGFCYPFGAADARVLRLTRSAGYRLGFAGPRGVPGALPADAPLALSRRPVYAWDRGQVPLVLQPGLLSAVAMGAARLANRIAVGTSIIRRVGGAWAPGRR